MKKYTLLGTFVCLLSYHWCFSQNLVPNPGFEIVSPTLTGEGQIILASPWVSPGSATTPDLFNSTFIGPVANPCDAVGVPLNIGGFAPALAGSNGYAGISMDFINNYYEYLHVPLSIPLQQGDIYRVEMDILKADSSQYACNRFGVLFSTAPVAQTGTGVMGLTPAMENAGDSVVTDTLNWKHLIFHVTNTGSPLYIPTAGVAYLTIGVFRGVNDPNLIVQDLGNPNPGCTNANGRAYYYIDNVIVKPDNELVTITTQDTVVCPNESTVLTANANVPVWWSDQFNPFDTLSTNIDYIATPPNVTTTYYLNGQTLIDSVTIYVVNPPVFELGPDTTLCEGDTILLNAFTPDAILYTWSNGDTAAATAVSDTGTYWALVDNIGCAATDTISFHTLIPNPPVDIGLDSTFCFFENDTLFLDAGSNGVAYSWIPFGDTTQVVKVLVSSYYQVTVTRANGCKRKAGFEVLEVCEPKIFIPTAFTPDGDGVNDVFLPLVNSITQYSLQIYSRWGQLLFSTGNTNEGWDGNYNGKEAPSGVYTYRLFYAGYNSDEEISKGKFINTFSLIR